MYAIKVMLESNLNTLFVIEGFKEKDVTLEIVKHYIFEHFQHLHSKSNIEIIGFQNDFIVKVGLSEYRITWSWVRSYQYINSSK